MTTLVRAGVVVTGTAVHDRVIEDGAVAVEDGRIVASGPFEELRAAHPDAEIEGSPDHAMVPGLVNAHHHCGGPTQVQHGVPDMLLELWILALSRARPVDIELATLLSAGRQLMTGVTSVVDVHSDGGTAEAWDADVRRAIAAWDASGMRVAFAPGIKDQNDFAGPGEADERFLDGLPEKARALAARKRPGPDTIGADDYLAIMDSLIAEFGEHERIDIWYGPPGPPWVSDGFLQRIDDAARRHGVNVQTHVSESFYEKLQGPKYAGRPNILHLADLGVLGPHFSIAHGVWISNAEMAVMAETGTAVSHNPSSNLRLRAGIAPLNAYLASEVTTAIGMDGTTLNDDEDMWTEMRLALRLARGPSYQEPAPSPRQGLDLATRGGARLMRKEDRLGRLAPGHDADLVLLRTERIRWPWVAPETDPLDLLMMRAKAADVDRVMVAGEWVVEDGRPTRIDMAAVAAELGRRLAAEPYPAEMAEMAATLLPHLEAWYGGWDHPERDPHTRYNSRR